MGPIKIKIKTSQIEDNSEYGGGDCPAPQTEEKEKPGEKEIREERESCYRYEGEDCFYTEPASGAVFKWDKTGGSWAQVGTEQGKASSNKTGGENGATPKYKMVDGTYVYLDKLTGQKHKWNLETNQWDKIDKQDGEEEEEEEESEESEEDENMSEEEKKARQYRKRKAAPGWDQSNFSEDPDTGARIYRDPKDGMQYEFDKAKNAWVPRIDEDFMANYQLGYGFTADGVPEPTKPQEEEKEQEAEKEVAPKKPKVKGKEVAEWFDEDQTKSTKVYVSNLPLTISEEDFVEFMSKCGMVEFDARTKKPKVKLYKDGENQLKGDGLCSYIKPESVELALTILDGSDFEGKRISVQRAKFEMKGDYDPKLKPKKLSKKQIEKAKKQKERLFAWVPDKMRGERGKHEKVVIIKNMFDVVDLDNDPGLILDYSNNIRAQCSKFGSVVKVLLHDKHPEGVCQIFFKEPAEADMAVQMLNGRMFGKKLMSVETWDGRTKYKVEESSKEENDRLDQWEKYLQEGEDKEEGAGVKEKGVTE